MKIELIDFKFKTELDGNPIIIINFTINGVPYGIAKKVSLMKKLGK